MKLSKFFGVFSLIYLSLFTLYVEASSRNKKASLNQPDPEENNNEPVVEDEPEEQELELPDAPIATMRDREQLEGEIESVVMNIKYTGKFILGFLSTWSKSVSRNTGNVFKQMTSLPGCSVSELVTTFKTEMNEEKQERNRVLPSQTEIENMNVEEMQRNCETRKREELERLTEERNQLAQDYHTKNREKIRRKAQGLSLDEIKQQLKDIEIRGEKNDKNRDNIKKIKCQKFAKNPEKAYSLSFLQKIKHYFGFAKKVLGCVRNDVVSKKMKTTLVKSTATIGLKAIGSLIVNAATFGVYGCVKGIFFVIKFIFHLSKAHYYRKKLFGKKEYAYRLGKVWGYGIRAILAFITGVRRK